MVLTLCSWGRTLARGMESSAFLRRTPSTEGNRAQLVRERTTGGHEEGADEAVARSGAHLAPCLPSFTLAHKDCRGFHFTLTARLKCSGREGLGG